MNLLQGLRLGILEIKSHKMQSFLTLFGVAVGITSVIAMTGIMTNFETHMVESIHKAGQGRLFIWPRETMTNKDLSKGLDYDDALAIRRNFPGIPTVSPSLSGHDNLFMGNFNSKVEVRGVTPQWAALDWNYTLRGRFIDDADIRNFSNVCVLIQARHDPMEFWRQKDALDPLFAETDPLGKEVRLGQNSFRVVGVLQEGPRDNLMNFEMGNKNVLLPITSLSKRLNNQNKVLWILDLDSGSTETSGLLAKRVFALLKRRHRGVEDFKVENISEKMGAAMGWAKTLALVMGAVAAIALFAGGVGIMNITLSSVHSRFREIGIRKSVGARSRDIQMQFLLEAITLSLTGGLLGVILGCGICLAAKAAANMAVLPSAASILVALGVSVGVGVASAWYPAKQASELDPIEALRYE